MTSTTAAPARATAIGRRRRIGLTAASIVIGLVVAVGVAGAPAAAFPPLEPVAVVVATPVAGDAPLTVSFDGTGSVAAEPIVDWAWTFGDGTTASGSIVTHLYTAPGSYRATLVVSTGGLSSLPRAVVIEVTERTVPSAPTGLSAVPRGNSTSSTVLVWTNTDTDQTWVRVERCRGPRCANFARVATVRGDVNAFIDRGLAAGTSYRYRVRSLNALGNSGYSNIATTRTLGR